MIEVRPKKKKTQPRHSSAHDVEKILSCPGAPGSYSSKLSEVLVVTIDMKTISIDHEFF